MDTKKLRQKILDLAIHGKLVPQDPNDEPASVLLERIRAEKERLIAEGKIKRSKKSATSDTSHYENVPFEVPEGWCWTSLNSVCTIFGRIGFRGYTKDDLVDSTGAITLSPSNIVDGVMNFEKCTYISWEKYEESPEIQVQNEDVLLVKTGSSYGKCAYVESLPKEATINPQFVVLKFIGCNPRFLTCCLQSNYARKQYEEFVLGTAIPTFTQVALGAMAIPMPPIEEQERIVAEVEKLLTIVDNIEQSKQDLSTAISQTKNRILDLAIHGKLVPQDANDEPASELLKRINPKAVASCDNPHYGNVPDGWIMLKGKYLFDSMKSTKPAGEFFKYIDIDSIDNKRGIVTSPKVLSSNSAPSRASRYTCQGDVLFSMVRPYLRNIAIVPENDCIASTGFFVCHPIPVMTAEFCYYLMKSSYIVDGLNQFMKGDNSPSINNANITDWIYPVPPIKEQNKIVRKIKELFRTIDRIAEALL